MFTCQTEKDSNLRYLKVRTEREFEGKSVEVGVVIDVEAVQALQAAHLCGPIRGQYSRCGPIRGQYYLLGQEGEVVLPDRQVLKLTQLP